MTWHKYHAKPTTVDGYKFDSLAEAARYKELRLLEKAGEIRLIRVHPQFPIVIKGQQVCIVEMDFSYLEGATEIIEDVKGRDLPMSRLKRKMFEAYYDMKVTVIKRV